MTGPIPFTIAVPDVVIDRIASRLAETRIGYAPEDDVGDWQYGTDARYLAEFVNYWRASYDWRSAERDLNRWPQFKAEVDGIDIHFIHVRGSGSDRLALILTHGWPGSVFEFHNCIERLAYPERFGGRAQDGLDLVIPSLPGFGWSGRPSAPIGSRAVARLWRKLMTQVLGYPVFGAQGGDWGSILSIWLAKDHADVVKAVHLNVIAGPPPTPEDDEETQAYWRCHRQVLEAEGGYMIEQATKPQTIGLALHDNPVGAAAWVLEKFHGWGDTHGAIESSFSKDQLITNLMTYLVNDALISSFWAYRGMAEEGYPPPERNEVPFAIAQYPGEIYPMVSRQNAERLFNVVQWTIMEKGGHFAALEVPGPFADDVGTFFTQFDRSGRLL